MRLNMVFALVAVAVCGVTLTACHGCDVWIYTCDHPDYPLPSDFGPDGEPDPCHRRDAGADADAGPTSSDECVVGECVKRPSGWDGPLWVWIGPNPGLIGSERAPDCPPGDMDREGYADLAHPEECEPCSCEPSHGSCELPSKLTVSTEICGAGTPSIPFNAPPAWDGTCDTKAQVPAGIAKSLTIAPLTVAQESCAVGVGPKPPAVRVVAPYWQTFARTCAGDDWAACGSPHEYCIDKTKAPFPGAHLCVLDLGDSLDGCDNDWPERHLIYKDDIADERKCTECTCGPPMGSMCTAQVYGYTDVACVAPIDGGYTITSVSPKCVDIQPPGQALKSKSATQPIYIPGTCEPSPAMLDPDGGTITVTPAFTLCCKPE